MRKLWSINFPRKVLNFLWRACRNVLPTAEALIIKRVNVLRTCSWCHLHNEDTMHTLFKCCFAREVWQSMGLQGIIPTSTEGTILDVLKHVFNTNTKAQTARICLTFWGLWVRRNSWVWNKNNMSVFGVNAMISHLLQDWERAQTKKTTSVVWVQLRKWCKPPHGWIKVNVDASCRVGVDYIGAGCVI